MIIWARPKSGSRRHSTGPNGERKWKGAITVKSNVPLELRSNILRSGIVPVFGAPYYEDPQATCSSIEIEQNKDNPYLWEVTCEWSTRHEQGKNEADKQQQPDLRRPEWSYQFVPINLALFRDLDGVLFADAAGSPFSPPPEVAIYADQITVTRYEASCDREDDALYMGATNSDAWLYAAAHESLVTNIGVKEVWEQNAWWYVYTYNLLVSPIIDLGAAGKWGGFHPTQILNAGPKYLEYEDASGFMLPTVAADGGYADGKPVLLYADGTPIERDMDGLYEDDPVYLEFRTKKEISFSGLNLVPPG